MSDQELFQIDIGKWSYGSNEATSVWRASGRKIKVVSFSMEAYTRVNTLCFIDGKWHDVLPSRKVHKPKDIFAAVSESEDAAFITRLHCEAAARTIAFIDE